MQNGSPQTIDSHVGMRMRMRRLMLDMSQEKLADALGVTFQQIQKYEKGANRISASRLHQISHVLQVPVPFFFDGLPEARAVLGDGPTPPYIIEFLATSDGLALVKYFMQINKPRLRRSVVNLVEQLARGRE